VNQRIHCNILIVMAVISLIAVIAEMLLLLRLLLLTLNLLIDFLFQLNQSWDMDESESGAHDACHFQQTEDDVPLIIMKNQILRFKDDSLTHLQESAPFDEITHVIPGIE
jgi:hypothetical protein